MHDPHPTMIGPFELLGELARGGAGVVYKARDTRADRVVVLKLLLHTSELHAQRLRREAEAMAHLKHRNVLGLHARGQHRGAPYLVLPFVPCESLEDRLSRGGPLSVEHALRYARQVGEGLAAAHAAGLLHRDVKPANVLIDEHDQALLTDFGLVKRTEARAETLSLSVQGGCLGTPGYWPPEQALGRLDQIGPPADVYGLGALLYALLTGFPPRDAPTLAAAVIATHRPLTPLSQRRPDAPAWLDELVHACLATDPAARPVLPEVLRALHAESAFDAPRPARRLAARAAAGSGLLLLAALLAVAWPQARDAPEAPAAAGARGPANAPAPQTHEPPAPPPSPVADALAQDPDEALEARLQELAQDLARPQATPLAKTLPQATPPPQARPAVELVDERHALERRLGARVYDALLAANRFSEEHDWPQIERLSGLSPDLGFVSRSESLVQASRALLRHADAPPGLWLRCLLETLRLGRTDSYVALGKIAEADPLLAGSAQRSEALATEVLWRAVEAKVPLGFATLSWRILTRDVLPHGAGLERLERVLRLAGSDLDRLRLSEAPHRLSLACAAAYLALEAPERSPAPPAAVLEFLELSVRQGRLAQSETPDFLTQVERGAELAERLRSRLDPEATPLPR
ncbi:MAG: serine/threonine protein kinase [Planctomycetes bacterium]|nr:serine/threonine protein kinase [Planctomycetota bacterium]